MTRPSPRCVFSSWAWLLAGSLCLAAASCSRGLDVRVYEASKQQVEDSMARLQGMSPAGEGGPAARGGDQLTYTAPESWQPGAAGGMRKAAFEVAEGDQKAEITVIDLAAGAGALLPNINRWRQQIQLPPVTEQTLQGAIEKMDVGGVEADYVELLGPADAARPETILGAVALHGGKAWFFKLRGDAPLVEREQQRFRDFLRSVKFEASDGAGNGD